MAARRKTPSKVDLQAVLHYVGERNVVSSDELRRWIVETSDCRERAAKDALSVLVRGGWLTKSRDEHDRRRSRYSLTEKGREDTVGMFGQGALERGRRLHSTCLSSAGRRRQAARRQAAENPLAEAVEAEARQLFGGIDTTELARQFIAGGGLGTRKRLDLRSPFRAMLRRELLGEVDPNRGAIANRNVVTLRGPRSTYLESPNR
jgi:Winged helix DNA-binding domain